MTRFITVNVGCDWTDCDVVAPEGDGTVVEKTVSIDGKQARAFLVCKPHLDDLEAVVLPLMQAGVKVETGNSRQKASSKGSGTSTGTSPSPEPGAAADGSLVCKVPDCNRHGRPLTNRTGMAQHVIRTHGYADLAAYEAQYGTVASVPRKSKNDTVEAPSTDQPEPSTIT